MFPKMRRTLQVLPEEVTKQILQRSTSGVLAVSGNDGYPYAVPLSYVYADGKLYFHCAKTGHKIEAIRRSDKASFCVIDQDYVQPEKFTTYYRSVIAFGRIRVLETEEEKRAALNQLAFKYAPMLSEEARQAGIDQDLAPVLVLVMEIEHITGKEGKDLAAQRRKENGKA